MAWVDLAFIHYPIDPAVLRPFIPPTVEIDVFNGSAWLGIVPFQMADVMLRPFPSFPFFTTFPEINLRTYVIAEGKPGVWFFSLDADSWPTVFAGHRFFDLPYFSAQISLTQQDGWHHFSSARRHGPALFRGRYRPRGPVFLAERGTFEHWATERYCLYSHSARTGLARADVHHASWPLQTAEVEIDDSTLITAAGLEPISSPPICHFSTGVEVIAFAKTPLCPRAG